MHVNLGNQLPVQLDQMAERLFDIGCVASAEVVDKLAGTARATGCDCATARPSLTKDQRRRELEQMRSEFGGGRRIVRIFDRDIYRDDKAVFITGSFVDAMIEKIVSREFPVDLG